MKKMSDMKRYYIVEKGEKSGPFNLEEIRTKNINPDTLVWYYGLEKWKKAESIEELKEIFIQPPPIIKQEEDINIPPIPSEIKNNDYELASVSARFGGYLILNVIVLIIFFAAGGTVEELEQSEGFFEDALWAGIGGGAINGIFYPFFSGNLGHKLLGLKVIHKETGKPINNIFQGYIREFLKGFSSMVIIPLIWLFFDENRQNLYDKMTKTLVVKSS